MWPWALVAGGLLLWLVYEGEEPVCVEPGVPMSIGDLERRLMRLGYLSRGIRGVCDEELREAVARFQGDHGLARRGSVDASTEIFLKSLTPDVLDPDWRTDWA